jgi:Ca2+-binding EF-hand superfamily protein
MSIAGVGAYGANSLYASFFNQISSSASTQSTGISSASACAAPPAQSQSAQTTDGTQGTGKAQLSSEILAMLIQLQSSGGMQSSTASSTDATTASATSSASGTAATTSASTSTNPIASLFSSIDTSGGSTISESDFESYLENLGATQSQADQLFSALGGTSSNGLSEQQLAQDAQNGAPPPPPSPDQMAGGLINAMGGSNGSVTETQFEKFVTANGGTTSEADQDFTALTGSSSGTLTASDLEKAMQKLGAQSPSTSQTASASGSISPILGLLDTLATSATSSAAAATSAA